MEKVTLLPPEKLFDAWIDPSFLPEGKDKYYLRNLQSKRPQSQWRHLTSDEIERLVRNNNNAASWDAIYVTDEFSPRYIKNNNFYGTVRIGRVSEVGLQFHDLRLPVGITNSSIHSCDIGDDCAIHDVHYLSHYIIGDRCMLFNIHEMSTTDHSKFGNGIVKDGEKESVRVQLEIMNETGCRKVYPFEGMTTADAYLWGKYVDDKALQTKLKEITQNSHDSHRGYYGTVGESCVIKTSEIIKDAKIGPYCYIKGASKLKNITILSSEKEATQIGENVILVNGIVGYGSRIFYGCTAVKFVIGTNCKLKYGARVIDSILGDNSTISCCEALNNLVFPAHEQHHNNSFLIASCLKGQSNMAAGATVGSNHNSRSNDNEVVAGRGFWPGLCTSIKHSSIFPSFTLLSKGAYPAELNIKLPFNVVSNNETLGRLEVMPAFWWIYNMYALARNNWKFQTRDTRVTKVQHIEFDTFAPDSMEEALGAIALLEIWTAKAWLKSQGQEWEGKSEQELRKIGADLYAGDASVVDGLKILGEGMEKSKREVVILKAYKAYKAYKDMITHYLLNNAIAYLDSNPDANLEQMTASLSTERVKSWVNMGGQLMKESDVDELRADIGNGILDSWSAIHGRYDSKWEQYPMDKLNHAYACYCELYGLETMTAQDWIAAIEEEKRIRRFICDQVRVSREKDYQNPFRQATYRNHDEMIAAIGELDENSFVKLIKSETEEVLVKLESLKSRV